MKKIIAIILTFVLTFALVGCSNDKVKNNPSLSNPTAELASFTESGVKVVVTNEDIYNVLKSQFGANTLVNMIDTKLLKDLNLFDNVSEESIKEEIKKACYGTSDAEEIANLTDKAEKEQKFLNSAFISNGIQTNDIFDKDIMSKYRIILSEKSYAKSQVIEDVKVNDKEYEEFLKLTKEEQDKKVNDYKNLTDEEKKDAKAPVTAYYFSDEKVSSEYANENPSTFKAIVVPFTSSRQALIALNQVGVCVNEGVWCNLEKAPLSASEVYNKFVELYNLVYGYKGEANFELNSTKINSNVNQFLKKSLALYATDSKNVEPDWYTVNPYAIGSGNEYIFALKFEENVSKDYNELTDSEKQALRTKYLDKLVDDSLTTAVINKKMSELRQEKNLVIYDSVVENAYVSTISSTGVEYVKTDEESKDIVAEIDGMTVSADQLFDALLEFQGAAAIADKLVAKRALYNKTLNPYYDMVNNKWLVEEKQTEIEGLVKAEKDNFKNGNYKEYGYDPVTTSWDTFIKSLYNVSSEEELLYSFLSEKILTEYATALNPITAINANKEFVVSADKVLSEKYWTLVSNKMNEEVNKKFKVKGIHLLISTYESVENYIGGSGQLDPKEWTEEQKTAAATLSGELIAFINDSKGTYEARLEKVQNAFKYAPSKDAPATYNGKEVQTKLVSDGGSVTINVSAYKSLGLFVKYESLGDFQEGKMVAEFNDAVKEIWDKEYAEDLFNAKDLTSLDKVSVLDKPIITKFGYHVYVNLESKMIDNVKMETVKVDDKENHVYTFLPTVEQIRTYTKNNNDSSLDSKVKNAITTYYTPISKDLSNDAFIKVMMLNAIKENLSSFTSSSNKVSKDAFVNYITLYTEYAFRELLTNISSEYVYVK